MVAIWSILSKITGMGKLESFNAVSSLSVGQSENFLYYKKIINYLPSNVLYTTAILTILIGTAAAYMTIIDPSYVCVAIIVCVMIMGYIAFLNLSDGIFSSFVGISLQDILGYIFYLVAWILNIQGNEIFLSSQRMGTKIVTNEFVAMQELAKDSTQLSQHTSSCISIFSIVCKFFIYRNYYWCYSSFEQRSIG